MPPAARTGIALSKDDWARIVGWKNRDNSALLQRQEYLRCLEETSRQMTKNWPNSLENVNKRNEELRRARIEAAEQANAKFYKKYMKLKQEEQQRLMNSARDVVFKDKDAPKTLLSAVIETVVQKERELQLKFEKKLRDKAERKKKAEDDETIRKAQEWKELLARKKKMRFGTNKQHQKEILEQAHEISERNRRDYEEELNFQKIDNIKAKQQMEAIHKFEQDFKAREKARIWSDMDRSRQEHALRRREQEAQDELNDKVQRLLVRASDRMECRRRATEEQIRKEKLAVLEKISSKLETGDAARDEKERAILQKAEKEKEAIAEARRQANIKKQQQAKQDRIDIRREFLEQEEQRIQNFNTLRQWEIMNRFKNSELNEEYKAKLRREQARKTQEYKADILKLWKERTDREAEELAALRDFYGPQAERKLRADDEQVLAYAHELLQEARHHGRPEYPLHRAIDRYCKMRCLPTPAPPPRAAPPAPEGTAHAPDKPGDKRDGLLPDVQPKATERNETRDYVRAGPANGLQRKDE